MIEVRHLSHSFGPHWALKDCSFQLQKGEFLFLSGPSGAGKTTLLRLLFAGIPVQRGEVRVAGFALNQIKDSAVPLLRRQVSVVFQDFKILPDRSVYDNVILPLQVRGLGRVHSDRRVRAVVRALGLDSRIHLLCGELSGGEQQRVAVARAFVVNPKVLLADEPTGNLDADLSFRLMDLFKQFQAYGTTMIVATHSQELVKRHPEAKIIRLEDGKITGANWPGAMLDNGLAGAPLNGFNTGDGYASGTRSLSLSRQANIRATMRQMGPDGAVERKTTGDDKK
ncbi:MAG: cell division ATP-binding protein FtsE [Deltaproteobacteria bacterium]|jgi:cell division transport system ATP-binding protein|nr:cell division ATP-binding protein FtsE [Deltaproteobacteria bacterium]